MFKIAGAGGKSGAARQAVEAENTLQSNTIVKVLEVLSEGPIVGIEGLYKDAYINNTPIENADGTKNFPNITGIFNTGEPDQPNLPGFEEVSAVFPLGTDVTQASSVTQIINGDNITAAIITLNFPQGLVSVDTSSGDTNGNSVTIEIYTKMLAPTIGTSSLAASFVINGKQVTAYQTDRRIAAPESTVGVPGSSWSFEVRRISADDAVSTERSMFSVVRWAEVYTPETALTYPNTAMVGIEIPAEDVGNQVPVRGYIVKGIICQVPDKYDPETRTYTGPFTGAMKSAWTDNTAWILYDLITNERYGLGEYIGQGMKVHLWEFYNCAVYNDGLVPDGQGIDEPRNTFNGIIQTQTDAWQLLQSIAASMQAVVIVNGSNEISLVQDRPTEVSKILTNSSVLGGMFTYSSSDISERPTAINVTYNNAEDRYLPRTVSEPLDTDQLGNSFIDKYGYNPLDIVAVGCVRESQARRLGRWAIYSAQYEYDNVTFGMSANIVGLAVGDVISIMDNDYITADNTTILGGRVLSVDVGLSEITCDSPVNLSETGYTFAVMAADYESLVERTIVGSGTTDTFTLDSPLPAGDYTEHEFYCYKTGVIEPRTYRITNITEQEGTSFVVSANFYNPQKWDIVELGMGVRPVYYSITKPLEALTGLTVVEDFRNDDILETNLMRLTWDYNPKHLAYEFWIRLNNGTPILYETAERYIEFENIPVGSYTIEGRAIGISRTKSAPVTLIYLYGVDPTTLAAPVNLQVAGTGAGVFNSNAPEFTWELNPLNTTEILTGALKDYITRAYTIADVLKVEYIQPYERETASAFYRGGRVVYNRDVIIANFGSPVRDFKISVASRDQLGRESTEAFLTCSNPAPPLPGAGSTVTGYGRDITITLDPLDTVEDAQDLLVVFGDTGFTPTLQKVAYRITATAAYTGATVRAAAEGTYYVRFAVSDGYNEDDLNWTPEFTVVVADDAVLIIFPTPDTPTGLAISQVTQTDTDGKTIIVTTAYWDAAADTVSGYTVGWKNLTDGDTEYNYIDVSEPRIVVPIWLADKSIDLIVRANFGDKHSAFTSVLNFSTIGDTTAPTAPLNLTSSQGYDAVRLTWDLPPEADYKQTRIYWSATNDRSTSVEVAVAAGDNYQFPELDSGLTGYFWAKSEDTTGNLSATYPDTTAGIVGTTSSVIDDISADVTILSDDYNAGNNGNYTAVTNPTVPSNAISYTTNSDGSIDATFIWSWAGTESTIDGFTIYFRGSTSSSTYTFGTTVAEEGTQIVPADKRSYVWRGIPADLYWTVGVQAYRRVTPKTGYLDGIIVSSLVKATGAGENPFRASATVAFNGQADTISGQGDLAVLNAVDTAQIVSNAITAAKTSLAAINSSTGNLNANTVAASQIVANSITSTEIYSGYVYAGTINASQITTGTLTAVTINSSKYVYSTNYGTALPNGVFAAIGGIGTNTIGVYGSSTNDTGVSGVTTVSDAFATGVQGYATGIGTGIRGIGGVGADCVGSSYGCVGQSNSGTGVWAKSASGTALNCDGKMTKSGTDWVQYLNADMLDDKHAGNSSGQVAVSNGTKCTNLNADKLDGYHARRNDNGTGAFIPVVDSNSAGIMEIGKYIDFHNTTSSNDYDVRVYSNSTTFEIVGNLHWSGTATGTYSSDITLKDNVKTIENALSNLCSIRGIEFDWINGSGHDAGVSAQEVLKQFPYLVEKTFDGKLGVKYLGFTGIFIESIKELSAKVDTLTERLDKQEKLIEKLLKLLDK